MLKTFTIGSSYDVLFLANLDKIVKAFKQFPDTRVLFSAEIYCWPDNKLSTQYPNTKVTYPYLNSGGFIGILNSFVFYCSFMLSINHF